MIESKGYKITPIDGDLAVSRNAEIGGDADIHGKARVAGSLKVEGFLDAPNIKGVVKGLFATEEELKREYPNPRPGWCAIVLADKRRGFLYLAKNREWEKQSEEAQPFDFIVDSVNVFASKGELADETQRAQGAENILTQRIVNETVRATEAENEIKKNAVKFNRIGITGYTDKLELRAATIDGDEVHYIDIPAATETKAGVVSAEDKKKFVKSITWNNDSDMNSFTTAGVYEIKGIVGNNQGNLPIMNTGENASFAARLVVTVSPEGDTTYRHSIGQTMVVSNSEGKETKVYTRNANVTSYDGGASYVYEWGNWGELQKNVNVDAVTSLDHLVDNGIYSGVLIPTGETFVLVVINNYAFASQHGTQKCISQFKYSVNPFGVVSFGKRVKIGNTNFPAEWDILNKNEIDRMLNNAVEQVIATIVDDAPETFDTLKEIADWIANDETGAVALANATKTNAAAITAERTRAIGQEGLLNNAIAEEKSRAEQAEKAINDKLDDEIERSVAAEGEINQNTIAADSLGYSTTTDDISLEFETLDGQSTGSVTIPAATAEKAGVMSAEDKKKLGNIKETNEDGFFLVDNSGNVAMSVADGIVDAVGLGYNLKADITPVVKDVVNQQLLPLEDNVVNINAEVSSINEKITPLNQTEENGFHITDVFGNSVFTVTDSGEVSYVGQGKSDSQQRNSLYRQVGEIAKKVNEIAPKADVVDSLLGMKKSGEHYIGSIGIPSVNHDRRNVILRVGLHHGAELGKRERSSSVQSEIFNDVFFDGMCEKNFSDIRFLTDGNILRHRLEHCGNYEVVRDNNFNIGNFGVDYSIGRVYIGKRYSDDGGITWNTLSNFTYGDVVFVDSRKMLYSTKGSKLYMTPMVNDLYDGVNTVEICDVSMTSTGNNSGAYIAEGSRTIIEDNDGYIYFGVSGLDWNAVVFRSINANMSPTDGKYVKEVYSQPKVYKDDGSLDYDFIDQHVHNLYYHKQTSTIYVGLDNSMGANGPRIIKSTDNGNSWNEVRLDSVEWNLQRGRDYTPAYISPDGSYMLGGGEVNILGGSTLCKVFNNVVNGNIEEKSIKSVINNSIGVRNIGVFDEDFLIVGLCAASGGNSDIQLALSEDRGENWRTIYSENVPLSITHAGLGVRYFSEPFAPVGGENRILVLGSGATVNTPYSPLVVYRGGDHYYGEAYVYVGDINAGETKTINVESGYMVQMPNTIKESRLEPVYSVLLNEGFGDTVTDSLGNVLKINGEYEWDSFNTDVRFGTHLPFVKDNNGLSGIKLKENAFIEIGKIKQLNFNKGYTVAFWYKWDTDFKLDDEEFKKNFYNKIGAVLSADNFNVGFFRYGYLVGNYSNNARGTGCRVIHKGMYELVCISVTNDVLPQIIISKNDDYGKQGSLNAPSSWDFSNLSEMTLRIGCATTAYNANYPVCLHSINIYDRVLDMEEVQALYKGGIRL